MNTKTQYFLDKLQEESAEVIQAISKIRRFGSDNRHPDRATTNKQERIGELEDFLALLAALEAAGFVDLTKSHQSLQQKLRQLMQ